jgi:hypothetical protein
VLAVTPAMTPAVTRVNATGEPQLKSRCKDVRMECIPIITRSTSLGCVGKPQSKLSTDA